MAKKRIGQQQQLHISSFIKQPASLKLLILAGTNIKITELSVISKCINLIKLDLSSNYLTELPLKFSNFLQMKILYLHDNQFSHIDIKNTQLEYISLFNNQLKPDYRKYLVQNNPQLMGIDYNIVTSKQRFGETQNLPIYSQIKWPIVQISANLQQEEDYLNLLKAQIFVISNVFKRTLKIQTIQKIFIPIVCQHRLKNKKIRNENIKILPSVLKAASKWKEFVRLNKKLRAILQRKNKQYLIFNQLQRRRRERGQGVTQIFEAFLPMVRKKMKVRDIIQRCFRSYRSFIPVQKELQIKYLGFSQDRDYLKSSAKLYFRDSEYDFLSKVCLYAKRLFFKQKDYDLCDQFNNLFKETGRKFYILRKKNYFQNETSWIKNSIHETSGYVLTPVGVDRKHLLYTKQGHRKIKVKPVKRVKKNTSLLERVNEINKKIGYLYDKYDKLVEYEIFNRKILHMILRIIRYMNAGNSSSIISTQTAYFQTEVIFDDQKDKSPPMKIKFHLGLEFFTSRVIAANIIQRSWRKYASKKKSINVIEEIRKKRAEGLISKWLRSLIFDHRMSNLITSSYYSSVWKEKQIYFQLDLYMNMPEPTNFLRLNQKLENKNKFYDILHKSTQVQIVQINRRRWLKVQFQTVKQALSAQIYFTKFTYRYLQGFYLKLFNSNDISDMKMLSEYEKNVLHLFSIRINELNQNQNERNIKTTLWIDNYEPYFIWSEVNAQENMEKFSKFDRHNSNVNIFIYNKHKRPLKVSCQIYWVYPNSLYLHKKVTRSDLKQKKTSVQRTPSIIKDRTSINQGQTGDISLIDLDMSYRNNLKKGKIRLKNKHILNLQQKIQRSQQKEIRNSSLGQKKRSNSKNHRSRIISDTKFESLSLTLNIRGK